MCAGQIPDLSENVGGLLRDLLGGAVGLAGNAVDEGCGVLGGIQYRLEVALDGLDRADCVSVDGMAREIWRLQMSGGRGCGYLRWCHVSLVSNKLAELETNF